MAEGKPEWLREKEAERARRRGFKRCINCRIGGDPCGYTKNTGKGRRIMYRCRKFPSVKFHDESFACEHYM